MKKILITVGIIAIAAVALSIAFVGYCFLTDEEKEVEYETYINENYSFKFDYPADWILHERDSSRLAGKTVFNVNFNELPLEAYPRIGIIKGSVVETDESLDDIRSLYPSENITDILIDGIPAFKFSFGGALIPYENNSHTYLMVKGGYMFAIKGNCRYALEVMAPKEKYSDYEQIFKHVINSFSFL